MEWTSLKAKLYRIALIVLAIAMYPGYIHAEDEGKSKADSLLKTRSVETLVRMRKALAKERERLLRSQEKLRDRGLDISQEFLNINADENGNQDKILVRIAEYYIEEAQLDLERKIETEYEPKLQEYERLMDAYHRGEITKEPEPPTEPRVDYTRAIEVYDLVIDNFPNSDLIDDCYYNKAFLLSKMGEEEQSALWFQKVIDEYPESEYAPEAYMNLAERFFAPDPDDSKTETVVKLNKAIQLYKNVLQYKDSPRYDEALYKLGWSYYRLAGENPDYYTDAIVYFTSVVKDIRKFRKLDRTGEVVRADVEPEALEFIAASFIDQQYAKNGVQNARSFVEKLGLPEYGIDIMENLGDRYAKIARWDEAINAYNALLDMYPTYEFAPGIQKKIADAYVAANNPPAAYAERKKLFENYGPHSSWYKQLESSDKPNVVEALDEAVRITEEALRTNIAYLYAIAEKAEQDSAGSNLARQAYQEFVDLCQDYLQNYPTDENAYDINWSMAFVMDTKLGQLEKAFAEYIKVSNDYLETSHQEDAAINAITVADSLVKLSRAIQTMNEANDEQLVDRQVQDLSPEEKMLAEAYDNYIKLFPESPRTPEILAAAGQLYYAHKKYALARKYYKTMVTKFPESQQKTIGLVSLMNSYFFLGQYRDAEIVARKIIETPDIPESQIELAKSRIGESIFKNAERLEQNNDYLAAAKEYRRVYEDAKTYVAFVDNALFRSARNFEKVNEWQKAIETYNILIAEYPESKHLLAALGNIAADYKEIGDFAKVAETNERIFQTFPGTPEAEIALYNASLFYAKAEAWADAIRSNNLYIQTYPGNPESKELLFENAKYYLKLGDLDSANRIYEEFAAKYPNDAKTIEAYYNRGEYFMKQGQIELAKAEFNKAIQRSEELKRTGQDPNLYYAAEANYKLGQILYDEYKSIQLSYPQEQLRAQLEQKRNLLGEVERAFAKVVQSGSIRGFEAMYRIAEAYEELANSITNQQFPPNLSNEELLVQKTQVFRAAVPAYEEAVNRYKSVMLNIPELAEKLEISLDSASVQPAPQPAVNDTGLAITKEVEVDSSREVALKWYNKTKEKISSILFNVAERSAEFIDQYLRVPNPNQGLLALIYEDQVLKTLVAPQVQVTIDAHLKNIQVAKELGLKNKYVTESERKVLLTRNILGEQYAKLTQRSLEMYRNALPQLETLIEQGESATDDQGRDYYAYQDEYLMQIVYNSKGYASTALNQYMETIELAKNQQINNDVRATVEEEMLTFAYSTGQKMMDIAEYARQKSEIYLAKFDSTSNANYQIGSIFFDDHNIEMTNNAKEIQNIAYEYSKNNNIENIWTQLLLANLVKLDPGTYLADMPRVETTVTSNSTWKATTVYQNGWNLVDFDDSSWGNATELLQSVNAAAFDSLGVAPMAIWVSTVAAGTSQEAVGNPLEMQDRSMDNETEPNPFNPDSLAKSAISGLSDLAAEAGVSTEPDTVTAYFRKMFNVNAKPVGGYIAIAGDNSYRLYLNDIYITGIDSTSIENVEVIRFDTFSEFLKEGNNLVAVSVRDANGLPRKGLQFYMLVELLPGEVSNVLENIRAKLNEPDMPLEQLKRVNALNKNRITK